MHIHELDTPALVLDLDRLEHNLARAQSYLSENCIAFRPHIKTHKMPQIARRQVDLGAVGLTCAKLGEAEVMANAGLTDLMIAYPIWGRAKLARLAGLAERCRITVVLDTLEVAEGISSYMAGTGLEVGVLVEVDTGMGRCGVAPGRDLESLCQRVDGIPGLKLRGIMTYQGHIRGTRAERETMLREEDAKIAALDERLRRLGLPVDVISGGSSPLLYHSAMAPSITENRSGTYVFNDRNMVASGLVTWSDCALQMAVTVVSTAVPGQIIVDGGSKTFTSDLTGEGKGFGHFVEDPGLVLEKMNEEHGYVSLASASRTHRVGDRLHVIPNHVCVVVNMHDEMWVHRGGEIVDQWRVEARGKVR